MPGHIRKRSRGDGGTVYQARYPDPARGGTAKIEKTFRLKSEADAWLTSQGAAVLTGSHVDPRIADRPFRAVVDAWRGTWVDLEPITVAGYEGILKKHLIPALGNRKIGSITHEAVQRYVARLIDEGLAPGTVRNVYAVLRSAMNAGVRLGMIRVNPCSNIRLPRASRDEMTFLTAEEVRMLAEGIDPHYRVFIYTAAYTGLRAGELAGLRRGSLDLLRGVVHVREALKCVNGKVSFGPTKTHTHRTVSLPRFLRDMLAEHLAAPTSNGTGPDALVFPSPEGSPLRHNNFYRRHFKPVVAGRPATETRPAVPSVLPAEKRGLRFHDLRHTCASLLIAAGAHPKAIQERLGHSSIQITMDRYGHLLPSVDESLASALDATHAAVSTPTGNVVALHGAE